MRAVVVPCASITASSYGAMESATHSSAYRCACMSARPGITNFPRPSMRRAPRGIVTRADGPTAAMRPSRTSTVASRSTESRVIVTTVAPVMATTPGVSAVRLVALGELTGCAPALAAAATNASENLSMVIAQLRVG